MLSRSSGKMQSDRTTPISILIPVLMSLHGRYSPNSEADVGRHGQSLCLTEFGFFCLCPTIALRVKYPCSREGQKHTGSSPFKKGACLIEDGTKIA